MTTPATTARDTTTPASARHVVVMGVSGSGKSTIAEKLRDATGWTFAEADEFHPQANIDKMTSGVPLTDDDRWPWLDALAAWMGEKDAGGESTIITCSALKRVYREVLRVADGVFFVHLDGPMSVLMERIGGRTGHFMPPSLLASQLDTLEPLEDGEPGCVLSIEEPPDALVERILATL